uniref:terminase large subunit domain-containing protein n=1 Tax=uncultured Sphingomonas sp. TaxID=158754 RepID=UPI0025D0855C|nr:terminase family protein [uncultured Sphingomonas sp.]
MSREARFWKWVAALEPSELKLLVRGLPPDEAAILEGDWRTWAHDGQCAPDGDWRTWVLMAGRGFGKTLAGSQWIAGLVATGEPLRIALVGATIDEARRIMVEGKSGLLTVAAPWVAGWHPSRRLLRFTTGAEATLFSGASPEALRGPEHHLAWCDELAKWEKAGECWDMLQLGLRLGERPRALVTTTPRPGPVLRRIMEGPGCVATGGRTHANPHLPAAFVKAIEAQYGGTRLGRQEVDGELFTDALGALWTVEGLERARVGLSSARPERSRGALDGSSGSNAPRLQPRIKSGTSARDERVGEAARLARIVIGVDPPAGGGTCGIVVCALDPEGIGHVLADHSVTGRSPEGWARAVADAAAVWQAEAARPERRAGHRRRHGLLRRGLLPAAGRSRCRHSAA